ncbi:MAG: tetratricopeptide repeat protein [Cytophagales bacterium]|nr:tetratricopeptide repeat protein [Cytophagales bacterium]
MKASNLDFDQVKRYLNGHMDEEERRQFEDRINHDPELARQVDLDQVLLEGIQLHYRGQLKEKLQSLDRNDYSRVKPVFPFFKAMTMAAGIIMLMVVGFFIFERKPDTEALYTSYFKPYYKVISDIERGEVVLSGIEDPFQLYEAGQYRKANELFENLLLENPDDYRLLFYHGLAYLNSGFTSGAIDNLSQVADKDDFLLSATARWYLGLAYLKENRMDQAIDAFNFLVEKDDGYAARAGEIIKELE